MTRLPGSHIDRRRRRWAQLHGTSPAAPRRPWWASWFAALRERMTAFLEARRAERAILAERSARNIGRRDSLYRTRAPEQGR